MKTNATYVTTYCNFPHRMRDGVPIGHECYVLPPRALEFERQGDTSAAIAVIQSAKPLRRHAGARVYVNRWGFMLAKGTRVRCHHPRGGNVAGKITRIYTMQGYGKRIDLDSGGSFAADDAFEILED